MFTNDIGLHVAPLYHSRGGKKGVVKDRALGLLSCPEDFFLMFLLLLFLSD